jgi:transposase
MIDAELFAKIRRLYFAEHWRIGTIVTTLGVHADTVANAISKEKFSTRQGVPRLSVISPYVDFINETLTNYPKLRATRLYEMIKGRGYTGSIDQLRRHVVRVRPRKVAEAYLRLRTMPGEQAQVDWGHFGKIKIGKAERPLSCFVMVLSYSRRLFAEFVLEQKMDSLLRCHRNGFTAFRGIPREILYDNMKTVVLERHGDHIRYHPQLLEFAGHYHFAPKPCAPYRGNEKGKVERTIQYIRHSFFAARKFTSLDDLNRQLSEWINTIAHVRVVPGSPDRESINEAFAKEQHLLLPLPEHPYTCDQVVVLSSGKTPYIRFDCNDYSIPHDWVGKPLTLVASQTQVRILNNVEVLATHIRSYEKMQIIEDQEHINNLAAKKRAASELRGRDRLRTLCSNANKFIETICLRGESIRHQTTRLNKLLDLYGAMALNEARQESMDRRAYSADAVNYLIEVKRKKKNEKPTLPIPLPDDPRIKNLQVKAHDLKPYDNINTNLGEEHDDN